MAIKSSQIATQPAPQPASWPAFFLVGTATLIGPLDTSVNIAFPNLTAAFEITIASIQWVIIAYVLSFAGLMLAFGRLADLIGHLTVFRVGLAVSAVAFVFCGYSQQFEWLLAARVLQGIGTAMVISCGPALLTRAFDETYRARALGGFTMILGLGSAVGPALGGIMVELWNWPSVFLFRAPLALITLLLTFIVPIPLPLRSKGYFDLLGAVTMSAGIAFLLMAVNQISKDEIGTVGVLAAIGLLVLTVFVIQQRRSKTPLLQLDLFRNVEFSLLNIAVIVVNAVAFSVWLLVPYFLSRETDLSVTWAGLILGLGPLGMMVAGQMGGFGMRRAGANRIAGAGALCIAAGVIAIGYHVSRRPTSSAPPIWLAATVSALLDPVVMWISAWFLAIGSPRMRKRAFAPSTFLYGSCPDWDWISNPMGKARSGASKLSSLAVLCMAKM